MSQALRDLPDPTEPAPVLPAANADDLLAKMADEAIDKLLAEADKGPTQPAIKLNLPPTPAPETTPAAVEAATAEAAISDMISAAAQEPAASTEPAPSAAEPGLELPPAEFHDPAPQAEAANGHSPEPVAPAEAHTPSKDDVKALLTEEVHTRPSPLLWPLWLLNAPFAWMSDRARQTLGLIGIVTLVPAVCALVYVFYMKKH